jgi:hypothetical protein
MMHAFLAPGYLKSGMEGIHLNQGQRIAKTQELSEDKIAQFAEEDKQELTSYRAQFAEEAKEKQDKH